MVNLLSAFTSLHEVNVGVIGDLVIDKYIIGSVARISPEAPVPVVVAQEQKHIPGMAGNVALNLVSLGAKVRLFGRVGSDKEGLHFKEYLSGFGVNMEGVVFQPEFPTPVKERVIASGQQLLRIDYEKVDHITAECETNLIDQLALVISELDIIALSDYKKGLLTTSLIGKIIKLAKQHHVKVIVDPKGEDYSKYQGSFLIKPNLQEAYLAAKLPKGVPLEDVASVLLTTTQAKHILITRSEDGMSLFSSGAKEEHFPVNARQVKDVTGAGDTVLAMMSFAIANGLGVKESIILANIAASLVIQKMGCAQVNLSEVAQEVVFLSKGSKIFDHEDLNALHQILSKRAFSFLSLSGKQQSSFDLLDALKKISQHTSNKVLVYVAPEENSSKVLTLLSSLEEVGYIVKSHTHMLELLRKFTPHKAFKFINDELHEVHNPALLLEELLQV